MRNMIFPAKVVEHCFAIDAPARFIEAARIVDARVDHFAVARADSRTDAVLAFNDDDLASSPRQSPCGGEANNAGSNDEAFDRLHWRRFSTPPKAPQPLPSVANISHQVTTNC